MVESAKSSQAEKIGQLCLILLFVAMITAPLIFFFVHSSDTVSRAEKRLKSPFPDFSARSWLNAEYQKQLEKYLDDRFGLRDQLVQYNAMLHVKALHTSSVSTVLVGNDGWLFYAGEGAIDDYRSLDPFTDDELQDIASGINAIQTEMDRRSITFIVFISPDKHTIYPEYLPSGVRKANPKSRFDQVLEYLPDHTHVTLIDPRPALISAKGLQRIYHVTDSHWNAYGAFIAYQELVKAIALKRSDVHPLTWDDFTINNTIEDGGDLAEALSIQSLLSEDAVQLVPKQKPIASEIPVHFSRVSFEKPSFGYTHPNQDLPSALILRDSFSVPLVPYIAETFDRTVFVKTDDVVWSVVDQEKPDIVILEIAERYLGKLLEDDPFVQYSL